MTEKLSVTFWTGRPYSEGMPPMDTSRVAADSLSRKRRRPDEHAGNGTSAAVDRASSDAVLATGSSSSNWDRMRKRANKPAAATDTHTQHNGTSSSSSSSNTAVTKSGGGTHALHHAASASRAAITPRGNGVADAGRISFGSHLKSATQKGQPGGAAGEKSAEAAAADAAAAVLRSTVLGPFPAVSLSHDESRYLALDCEMVGVGSEGKRSVLAQVVVVDWAGVTRYCEYVQPKEPVTDYRTQFSGIRPEHLRKGIAVPFSTAQSAVSALLAGKVVVGHGLRNDMKSLKLSHAWTQTRDTAMYRPLCRFSKLGKLKPRRLKHLAHEHLGVVIQASAHRCSAFLYLRTSRRTQ